MIIIGLVFVGLGVLILFVLFKCVQFNEMCWVLIVEEDVVFEMWLVWLKYYE